MSDDRDKVTPFRRRQVQPLPPGVEALSRHSRRAQPGAQELAARQAAPQRDAYAAALGRQESQQLIATGKRPHEHEHHPA